MTKGETWVLFDRVNFGWWSYTILHKRIKCATWWVFFVGSICTRLLFIFIMAISNKFQFHCRVIIKVILSGFKNTAPYKIHNFAHRDTVSCYWVQKRHCVRVVFLRSILRPHCSILVIRRWTRIFQCGLFHCTSA